MRKAAPSKAAPSKSKAAPRVPAPEQALAECAAKRGAVLRFAGRALHDDAGPLLSAAGLRLQLLKMDLPEATEAATEITAILDQAIERLRALSQSLNPAPVFRGGLRSALERLAEQLLDQHEVSVAVTGTPARTLSPEGSALLWEAAEAVLGVAVQAKATRIRVRLGASSVRIEDDGRTTGRAKALNVVRALAQANGLSFSVDTRNGTLVSVRHYATRRPAGG